MSLVLLLVLSPLFSLPLFLDWCVVAGRGVLWSANRESCGTRRLAAYPTFKIPNLKTTPHFQDWFGRVSAKRARRSSPATCPCPLLTLTRVPTSWQERVGTIYTLMDDVGMTTVAESTHPEYGCGAPARPA